MKQLHFIVQAKGGVGKSLLTYLFGLTKQQDEPSLFVDVDSSTQTSTRQLTFLGEDRTETLSLLNDKEVLVRDKFIAYLESLVETPFNDIYFDFGAPESEQLPALIERDLPFKEFLDELDFKPIFILSLAVAEHILRQSSIYKKYSKPSINSLKFRFGEVLPHLVIFQFWLKSYKPTAKS